MLSSHFSDNHAVDSSQCIFSRNSVSKFAVCLYSTPAIIRKGHLAKNETMNLKHTVQSRFIALSNKKQQFVYHNVTGISIHIVLSNAFIWHSLNSLSCSYKISSCFQRHNKYMQSQFRISTFSRSRQCTGAILAQCNAGDSL